MLDRLNFQGVEYVKLAIFLFSPLKDRIIQTRTKNTYGIEMKKWRKAREDEMTWIVGAIKNSKLTIE
jgi:hypothetical protein